MPRKKKTPDKVPPTVETYEENERAKRWLWIGVTSLAVLIAGIWFWSFKISIAGFSWQNTSEGQAIKNNYDQLDNAVNNESAKMRQEYLKTQFKRIVGEVVAETKAGYASDTIREGSPGSSASSTATNTINN